MDAKQLTSLVEKFSWNDKELNDRLEQELENGNIEVISQIKEWITDEKAEYLRKVIIAIESTAERGLSITIPLFVEIERMLNLKMDINEVIESMRHAVPPDELHEFYHHYEKVSNEYLEEKTKLFIIELQRITNHILINGVNDIPDFTDNFIFAENMILPLMDAWLQKPTSSIKHKFQEACWEAGHCDIEDWLKRRADMLRNEGIEVVADIEEKLFVRNESGVFEKV